MDGYDDDRWIPEDKYNDDLNRKFRNIAERAIEEFKIIGEYATDRSARDVELFSLNPAPKVPSTVAWPCR